MQMNETHSKKPNLKACANPKLNSVPVWLRLMKRLPRSTRLKLVDRWQNKAGRLADYAEFIAPEIRGK